MLCEFGELSFPLIYLLICPFGSAIRTLSFQMFSGYYHEFLFSCFVMFLSEIASGTIPFILQLYGKLFDKQQQQETSIEIDSNNKGKIIDDICLSIDSDTDVNTKKRTIKKHIILALCSLLDFIGFNFLSLGCGGNNADEGNALNQELRNTKIIPLYLFSKLILRSSFYRHHIFSITMIICGVVLNSLLYLSILNVFNKTFNYTDLVFLLLPISYICSSLQSVLEKFFMDTYKESPYYLMLYEGIYGSVFTGFTAIPLSYTTCKWSTSICNKYKQYFSLEILGEDLKQLKYWGFNLSLFLGGIICNVFTRLAIEAFSPCHQNVSDCLSSLLILFFEHEEFTNALKLFPGAIFITIGSFIHSEIIIVHICGLSENTKKEINARSASDTAISLRLMDSKTIGNRRGSRFEI